MKQHGLNFKTLDRGNERLNFEKIEYVDYSTSYRRIVMRVYYLTKNEKEGWYEEAGCKVFATADEGNKYYIWCIKHGFHTVKMQPYCGD